jgi:hypothetical protein
LLYIMMRFCLSVLLLMYMQVAAGQVLSTSPVWSMGIHFNPAFTTPVMDGESKYDAPLKPSYAVAGINTGFNLQYRIPEMTFETGISYIQKTFRIRQRLRHFENLQGFDDTRNNHFTLSSFSSSIELPLEVSYCLHHHDKRAVYDLHAVVGCSGEFNYITGSGASTKGNSGSIIQQNYTLDATGTQTIWVNALAGFKIHAILRIIGLIDYGLIWHVPIQRSGPYTLSSEVKDYTNGGTITYTGTYNPHMGYLDVKFAYYFLNLDPSRHYIRYRGRKDDERSKKSRRS